MTVQPSPTPIGIAVVIHAGCVLVGIRGPGVSLAGRAEFPGGKCLPGESPAACAIRECAEETGLEVEIVGPLADYLWSYPHGSVHLHFFTCRVQNSAAIRLDHLGFRWVRASDLATLDFPKANDCVLKSIVAAAAAH